MMEWITSIRNAKGFEKRDTTTTTTIMTNVGREERQFQLGMAIFCVSFLSFLLPTRKYLLVQQHSYSSLLILCSLINVISHTAVIMGLLEKNHISIFAILLGVAFDLLSQLFYIMGLWIHILTNKDDFFFHYTILLLPICLIGYHLYIHTRALCMTHNWKRLDLVVTSAWNNIHGNPGIYASDHFFAYSDLATHTYILITTLLLRLRLHQGGQQQPSSLLNQDTFHPYHYLLSQRQITILNALLWMLFLFFITFVTIMYYFFSKKNNHHYYSNEVNKNNNIINQSNHHHHVRIHKKRQVLTCPCHVCHGKTSFSISWMTNKHNVKTLCFCDLWYCTFFDLYEIINNKKQEISLDCKHE